MASQSSPNPTGFASGSTVRTPSLDLNKIRQLSFSSSHLSPKPSPKNKPGFASEPALRGPDIDLNKIRQLSSSSSRVSPRLSPKSSRHVGESVVRAIIHDGSSSRSETATIETGEDPAVVSRSADQLANLNVTLNEESDTRQCGLQMIRWKGKGNGKCKENSANVIASTREIKSTRLQEAKKSIEKYHRRLFEHHTENHHGAIAFSASLHQKKTSAEKSAFLYDFPEDLLSHCWTVNPVSGEEGNRNTLAALTTCSYVNSEELSETWFERHFHLQSKKKPLMERIAMKSKNIAKDIIRKSKKLCPKKCGSSSKKSSEAAPTAVSTPHAAEPLATDSSPQTTATEPYDPSQSHNNTPREPASNTLQRFSTHPRPLNRKHLLTLPPRMRALLRHHLHLSSLSPHKSNHLTNNLLNQPIFTRSLSVYEHELHTNNVRFLRAAYSADAAYRAQEAKNASHGIGTINEDDEDSFGYGTCDMIGWGTLDAVDEIEKKNNCMEGKVRTLEGGSELARAVRRGYE